MILNQLRNQRTMRLFFLFIFLQINGICLFSQNTIIARKGTYVEAENYGGKIELKRFLQQELNYPKKSFLNKIQGTVLLSFVVDEHTGNTSQLEVIKSVNEEIDHEALRLFKLLLFKPAYFLGNPVTTRTTLKIKFSIKKQLKNCEKRGYTNSFPKTEQDATVIVYKENEVQTLPKMIFKDTLENFYSFAKKNLIYPHLAYQLDIEGTVKLSCVIEPSGRISNIKVKRTLGGGTINEAIRLLKLIQWKPGELNSKKVRVSRVFSLDFQLPVDENTHDITTNF